MRVESVTTWSGTKVGRRTLMGGMALALAAAGVGCSFQDTTGEEGAARLRLATGPVNTLDPHIVSSAITLATAGLLEGLVLQNDDSTDVVPGAADSWEASDDEMTYTFHLREGGVWSNGDPITAEQVVWSYRRLMTPTGATANAAGGSSSYQAGLGIKGAVDFASGALTDWEQVGVKAIDESTVEITLAERSPDFLISMTHYSMVLLHPDTVEAEPTKWMLPENFVGSAAFVTQTWSPNSAILMRKNPEYWDAANVALDEVELRVGGNTATNVVAFKSGELDFVRVSGEMVMKDAELADKIEKVDGYRVAYLQTMFGGHPAMGDPRVRQALSLAIDREALAELDGFSRAGTSLIPDAVEGWSEDLAIPYDVDRARSLLQAGGDGVKKARIQASADVPILSVLKEQWREALGLELAIDVMESGLFTSTRMQPYKDASTLSLYYGTYGGLPTINTWVFINFDPNRIRQMSLSVKDWEAFQAVQNDKSLDGAAKAVKLEDILSTKSSKKAQEFAALATKAKNTIDPQERMQLFIQADLVRREVGQSIPLLWSPMLAVVSDRVSGLHLRSSPEQFYFKDVSVSETA